MSKPKPAPTKVNMNKPIPTVFKQTAHKIETRKKNPEKKKKQQSKSKSPASVFRAEEVPDLEAFTTEHQLDHAMFRQQHIVKKTAIKENGAPTLINHRVRSVFANYQD